MWCLGTPSCPFASASTFVVSATTFSALSEEGMSFSASTSALASIPWSESE
ncbi:uncharacterized protein DS421_19g643380 [Arachis hypogaea]|uniref:Uncharacterized protein n=1 Tax=Arachis hypogaea TaxID=3818 RepID=A0A6B9V4V9_ARAHY|nr:uncharacterized protein DS421_19g643380 [Arachis hypogaea]